MLMNPLNPLFFISGALNIGLVFWLLRLLKQNHELNMTLGNIRLEVKVLTKALELIDARRLADIRRIAAIPMPPPGRDIRARKK